MYSSDTVPFVGDFRYFSIDAIARSTAACRDFSSRICSCSCSFFFTSSVSISVISSFSRMFWISDRLIPSSFIYAIISSRAFCVMS